MWLTVSFLREQTRYLKENYLLHGEQYLSFKSKLTPIRMVAKLKMSELLAIYH